MKMPTAGAITTVLKQWGKHIFKQTFTPENGTPGDFLLMETVSGIKPVIFMALTEDKKVIAIRQFRYGANTAILELPGGLPKAGQTPEDVLRAELLEETGYVPGTIIQLSASLWFEPAFMRVQYIPMLAVDCRRQQEPKLDEFEVMETQEIPLQDWLIMCHRGLIVDSKSLAITLLAMPHMHERKA